MVIFTTLAAAVEQIIFILPGVKAITVNAFQIAAALSENVWFVYRAAIKEIKDIFQYHVRSFLVSSSGRSA